MGSHFFVGKDEIQEKKKREGGILEREREIERVQREREREMIFLVGITPSLPPKPHSLTAVSIIYNYPCKYIYVCVSVCVYVSLSIMQIVFPLFKKVMYRMLFPPSSLSLSSLSLSKISFLFLLCLLLLLDFVIFSLSFSSFFFPPLFYSIPETNHFLFLFFFFFSFLFLCKKKKKKKTAHFDYSVSSSSE